MRLFLLLLGNDEPAVAKAVAVIHTSTATRRQIARKAFGLLVIAAAVANALGLAIIFGGRQ
jgi:hypothetical protein